MASSVFCCKIKDCLFYNKAVYSEKPFFKRHLISKHSFDSLVQIAFENGYIEKVYPYPSKSYILNTLADKFQVSVF